MEGKILGKRSIDRRECPGWEILETGSLGALYDYVSKIRIAILIANLRRRDGTRRRRGITTPSRLEGQT